MATYIVSYVTAFNESYLDAIETEDILNGIVSGQLVNTRVLTRPKLKPSRAEATISRRDALTVALVWPKDSALNIRNEITPGVMTMKWNQRQNVLKTSPDVVEWKADGDPATYYLDCALIP